jgi:hypothetical protein
VTSGARDAPPSCVLSRLGIFVRSGFGLGRAELLLESRREITRRR